MEEYATEWKKVTMSPSQQRCQMFVRTKLVSTSDADEDVFRNKIKNLELATDFHLRSAPRAISPMFSCVKMWLGKSSEISASLLVKRNLSLEDVQKSMQSIGYTMSCAKKYEIPSSLASLSMLCGRIEDDLMARRIMFRRQESNAVDNLYTKRGKRLQRAENINDLFEEAQLLNQPFHDVIESLMFSLFGDSGEFVRGPIKTPARGIEKVVRRSHLQKSHIFSQNSPASLPKSPISP